MLVTGMTAIIRSPDQSPESGLRAHQAFVGVILLEVVPPRRGL
jgi:hypothetical protein